jgi:hypothetical protein
MPAHSLSWSPDGGRFRFAVTSSDTATSLFEAAADGSTVQPLLPGWNNPPMEWCGNWSIGGKYFLFLSARANGTHIWARAETTGYFKKAEQQVPIQLTSGPLSFGTFVRSEDGKSLFGLGAQARGELARYDAQSRQFVPYLGGISAQMLDFSADGQWVTYVAYPEGTLWRSKMDGSQKLQLTFPPVLAYMPRWSPDSQQIVFVDTNSYFKTWLISANGGEPKQLMPGEHNDSDPGWFPDGNRLVFVQSPASRDSSILKIIDVRTSRVSTVSGSEGLGKPRLSPDGRYLSASPMFTKKHVLLVFDFSTQKWKELLNKVVVNERTWSRNGDYIYFDTCYSENPALCRVRVKDGKLERLASLKDLRLVESYGVWSGLTSDGPIVLRDIGMQEIYALDWEAP